MLGSARKLSLGVEVCSFLEVVTTSGGGRVHGGTARERTGGVLNRGDAKLIILLDDLIDPWLPCGGGRGLMTLGETAYRQRGRWNRRGVQRMRGVGIGTDLTRLPTREIKIIVPRHVCQFRFGHSRASFFPV